MILEASGTDIMGGSVDWRLRLRTSESKSLGIDTGNSVMMSSYNGWGEHSLPKLLIIWRFDKKRSRKLPSNSRPGRLSNARDLSASIVSYELFYIDSTELIVPWTESPRHSELVKMKWSEELHDDLSRKVDNLHEAYRDRPIRFQKSFKNAGGIVRLQYQVSDYRTLPRCPPDLEALISTELERLVGAEIRLWKDLSGYRGGPKGWLDEDMAEWEHRNTKHHGLLNVKIKGGDWVKYPGFKKGREDYWTGFAVDFLMDREIQFFEDLGGHSKGADHSVHLGSMQKRITDYGRAEGRRNGILSRISNLLRW